jgi:hypothetical protein
LPISEPYDEYLLESLDALKDAIQLSIFNGEQRKTKEILRWTRRKQRRHIRTEELYNYLIDRPSYHSVNTTEIVNTTNQTPIVDDLQTFRQALVMDRKKIFFSLFFLIKFLFR